MCGSLVVRCLWYAWACCNHVARRKASLVRQMATARTYAEWAMLGAELDELQHKQRELMGTPSRPLATYCAVDLMRDAQAQFQRIRESGDIVGLMYALRSELYRDFGNMTNR